jgi:hypothetical protein
MKIHEQVLEEIRTNEDLVKDLSTKLDITCEQVKDLLVEYSLDRIMRHDDGDVEDILKYKYLESKYD